MACVRSGFFFSAVSIKLSRNQALVWEAGWERLGTWSGLWTWKLIPGVGLAGWQPHPSLLGFDLAVPSRFALAGEFWA